MIIMIINLGTESSRLKADGYFSKSFFPARTLGVAAEDTTTSSSSPVIRAETALRKGTGHNRYKT